MTDVFLGRNYEIVAWGRHQEPVYYHEFGSYSGEWLLVAVDQAGIYHVYKDWFGSCSGCDAYEAEFSYDEQITREKAAGFVEQYLSFIEVPPTIMRNLAESGRIGAVFPANIRDEYSDIDYDDAVKDITAIVKLREGLSFAAHEVLEITNQEIKQRALRSVGYDRFIAEVDAKELHRDGRDRLIAVGEGDREVIFLDLQDFSTSRRYLLRVPPGLKRVREAKAWTFSLQEEEYAPLIET